MKPFFTLLLLAVFSAGSLSGGEDPRHREEVGKGTEASYQLDYGRAFEIYTRLREEYPESPVGYGMIALTSWSKLLYDARNLAVFRYGVPTPFDDVRLPEEMVLEENRHFMEVNDALLDMCEKLIEKNPQDALAHYFKGVYYENLSTQVLCLYGKAKKSSDLAKIAGKSHEEALSLDPSLVDAKTSMAVMEYVVGDLPWIARQLLKLFLWLPGNKQGAIDDLEEVIEKGTYRSRDAMTVLALLQNWSGEYERPIELFQKMRKMYPRNYLLDVGLAVTCEIAVKDPKSAIGVNQELLRNLQLKAPGIHPAEIHLRIGKNYAKLKEYSLALEHFQKALDTDHRAFETKPLAWYNMALVHEERNEKTRARECYEEMLRITDSDELIKDEIERAREKTW